MVGVNVSSHYRHPNIYSNQMTFKQDPTSITEKAMEALITGAKNNIQ